MKKSNVFLTGATGNMGRSVMEELLKRNGRFNVAILARPSKKNRKLLKRYSDCSGLSIIWGDLMKYEDVLKGVTGSDYVLHLGGMVSPLADTYPEKTMKVNVGSARNIIKAVKAQSDPDRIGIVYVGSVAQLGNHFPPNHWGRSGDPVCTGILDYYSLSKCIAELEFAESGLKKWVSIRLGSILYPELLMKADNPITFHVPLKGVLEWCTLEDSGRAIANACEEWVPDSFWRNFYNLSSGASYRMTNYEFESRILKTISCPPIEKVFDCRWFATRNFHGEWYLDADLLEEMLHFRDGTECSEYFRQLKRQLPWYFSLARIVPAFLIRMFMKHVASSEPLGTLYWKKHHVKERIDAHFGSQEEMEKIPEWKDFDTERPGDVPVILDHGYDESKPEEELGLEDMRQAAAFRGGKCVSKGMVKGDLFTPLEWECQFGHRFLMSPNAILKGGHWCPDCLPRYEPGRNTWKFEEIIKDNHFLAQLFTGENASH